MICCCKTLCSDILWLRFTPFFCGNLRSKKFWDFFQVCPTFPNSSTDKNPPKFLGGDRQIDRFSVDMATYRLNWPRGNQIYNLTINQDSVFRAAHGFDQFLKKNSEPAYLLSWTCPNFNDLILIWFWIKIFWNWNRYLGTILSK